MDGHGQDLHFRAMATQRPETPYRPPPGGLWADRLRFAPGLDTWRTRGTPDCLLMATVAGAGRVGHEHGTAGMLPGDVLVLLPDAPHDYGMDPRAGAVGWEVRWAHFQPTAVRLERLRWPELSPGIRHLRIGPGAAFDEITAALARAAQRLHQALPAGPETVTAPPHALALAENAVDEALLLADSRNPARGVLDTRVRAATEFLSARLDRPLRLADAARAAGLSVSRLARLFRSQTGTSVQAYIEAQRLALARQRLTLTDEPIQDIAAALGFTNPFYFTRRFAKHAGMSPREYRRRAR